MVHKSTFMMGWLYRTGYFAALVSWCSDFPQPEFPLAAQAQSEPLGMPREKTFRRLKESLEIIGLIVLLLGLLFILVMAISILGWLE